jgi:hypothetical protein
MEGQAWSKANLKVSISAHHDRRDATMFELIIPEDDEGDEPYPGSIEPAHYDMAGLVALLRQHEHDPEAVQFLADMLEE